MHRCIDVGVTLLMPMFNLIRSVGLLLLAMNTSVSDCQTIYGPCRNKCLPKGSGTSQWNILACSIASRIRWWLHQLLCIIGRESGPSDGSVERSNAKLSPPLPHPFPCSPFTARTSSAQYSGTRRGYKCSKDKPDLRIKADTLHSDHRGFKDILMFQGMPHQPYF